MQVRPPMLLGVLLYAGACERSASPPSGSPRAADEPRPTATAPTDPSRTWTFDADPVNTLPPGITATETGGVGTPATWAVVAEPSAPTPPHAFGVTRSDNDKRSYNLAVIEGTHAIDVDLSVMVRARGGELNRGGGPIWRMTDPNNYYVARWDPREDNAYLYVVQGGTRTALAKVDIKLDPNQWHSLRVIAQGPRIELFIDDHPVLSAEDHSLPHAGMIGLWTKSDATTIFDDLWVSPPR